MPDPKPQLSPEKQKQLKEATAFINDKVKKPGKFSIPKDMLDLLVESGEIKDVPKPETTKQESKPRLENQDITPELQEMVSQARRLNQGVFTNCYNDLFPEHIPTPNFSPETMEFIRKGELAPFYLPEMNFGERIKLTKDTDLKAYYSALEVFFPRWCLPNRTFFSLVQKYKKTNGKLGISPDSLKLTNQWVAIETAPKPNYDSTRIGLGQAYSPTMLIKNIGDLMDNNGVEHTRVVLGQSRNVLTGLRLKMGDRAFFQWSEITGVMIDNKGHTKLSPITNWPVRTNQGITDYAEKVLNSEVSLPTALQWNLLANMLIHQESMKNNQPIQKPNQYQGLGSTTAREWNLDEKFCSDDSIDRLISGYRGNDGLSDICNGVSPLVRYGEIGFRLLVVTE